MEAIYLDNFRIALPVAFPVSNAATKVLPISTPINVSNTAAQGPNLFIGCQHGELLFPESYGSETDSPLLRDDGRDGTGGK
jgi:hypothetical protein